MKKITGILIDVWKKEVREVTFEDVLDSYYSLINCDIITTAPYDEDHDLIVDDEGLLKNPDRFFSFNDVRSPQYAGNGIIIGFNNQGEWISHRTSLNDIRRSITFFQIIKDDNGNSLFMLAERCKN